MCDEDPSIPAAMNSDVCLSSEISRATCCRYVNPENGSALSCYHIKHQYKLCAQSINLFFGLIDWNVSIESATCD